MSALRIATVPDRHPYLSAVLPAGAEHVSFPGAGGQWAPSALLGRSDPAVLLADIDVVHAHFGYESLTKPAMQQWVAAVRASPAALVVTVHDLRNPHHADPGAHEAHLDTLIGGAEEVITLTAGAAREIARGWGRSAVVVPHPSLFEPALLEPAPTAPVGRPARVGVHLKSLRGNILEPSRVVLAAATGARRAGATLRVDVHPETVDHPRLDGVRAAADAGLIDLHVHERFTDIELYRYLRDLDVSVLPYRFGTHSGWLELCHDLGTAAVVPDCGYYLEQWPAALGYRNNERDGLDERSLADAVEAAVRRGAPAPADRAARDREQAWVRSEHARIYAGASARESSRQSGRSPVRTAATTGCFGVAR